MAPKRARISQSINEAGPSRERLTAEEKGKAPANIQQNEEHQAQAVA